MTTPTWLRTEFKLGYLSLMTNGSRNKILI